MNLDPKEMMAPTQKGMALNIMDSGKGADSMDCVNNCLEVEEGMTVLELGPGSGWATAEILKKGVAKVHAIEISDVFRDVLTKENADTKAAIGDGKLVVTGDDCIKIPLEDGSVDRILGFNVVYFLKGLPDYLKEMNRVLKPGGKLVWACKPGAITMFSNAPDVYVNLDWDKIVADMSAEGFDTVKGKEMLEANLAYIPITGTKK